MKHFMLCVRPLYQQCEKKLTGGFAEQIYSEQFRSSKSCTTESERTANAFGGSSFLLLHTITPAPVLRDCASSFLSLSVALRARHADEDDKVSDRQVFALSGDRVAS